MPRAEYPLNSYPVNYTLAPPFELLLLYYVFWGRFGFDGLARLGKEHVRGGKRDPVNPALSCLIGNNQFALAA